MVKNLNTDVTIIGGGLLGGTLSCALASGGLRSIVIERQSIDQQQENLFDIRTTALALTGKKMMESLGLWSDLDSRVTPILGIRVAEERSHCFLHFNHDDIATEALGYMVENLFLRRAVFNGISRYPDIKYIEKTEVLGFSCERDGVQTFLSDGRCVNSALIIGADGRNSFVRRQTDIPITKWSYNQTAIVCTVEHKKCHHNIAHELFFSPGPLAILPLEGNRSSVVWTEKNDYAAEVMKLKDSDFRFELFRRIGDFLEPVRIVGPRSTYPLHLQYARESTRLRLALAGDAAHALHPIAGQGFNMGLRDVAALAEVLVEAYRLGLDVGESTTLKKYERWRRFDNTLMIAATDSLNWLFSNNTFPLQVVRRLGLAAVNLSGPLKKIFMRQAMGLTGKVPSLMKGEQL